jgi:DNA (cytosine-5)-methyltransferase 1
MIFSAQYSVKHNDNGVGRIYISGKNILSGAGLDVDSRVQINEEKGSLIITKCTTAQGIKVLNTKRGAILELKTKLIGRIFKGFASVLVKASKKGFVISPCPADDAQRRREARFIKHFLEEKTLFGGSLYAGIGQLTHSLHSGLIKAGIKPKLCFSNEKDMTAAALNLLSPIWEQAPKNAEMVNCDIRDLRRYFNIPEVDHVDVSYPCSGQSTLAKTRDIDHPDVGDLFIDTIAVLRDANPCLITIECTPAFLTSATLRLMKQALKGYTWDAVILEANHFGEIERRRRACVTAISSGLSDLLEGFVVKPCEDYDKPILKDFMDDTVSLDAKEWKAYEHVMKKSFELEHNHKPAIFSESSSKIATLTANYACPKAGTPLIKHSEKEGVYRLLNVQEHASIRRLPERLSNAILKIASGESDIYPYKSVKKAHSLLGLSVSKRLWESVGYSYGTYFKDVLTRICDLFGSPKLA